MQTWIQTETVYYLQGDAEVGDRDDQLKQKETEGVRCSMLCLLEPSRLCQEVNHLHRSLRRFQACSWLPALLEQGAKLLIARMPGAGLKEGETDFRVIQ